MTEYTINFHISLTRDWDGAQDVTFGEANIVSTYDDDYQDVRYDIIDAVRDHINNR